MENILGFTPNEQTERTVSALQKNQYEVFLAQNRDSAREIALSLLPIGCTVSHGGSMTLMDCKIPEALRGGGYNYLDRDAAGLSGEDVTEIYRRSFLADWYLGSANAIIETGGLFNVDGNGNRVAAYIYGPKNVLIVAGINKIVPDVQAALERVRTIAAPANARRLTCQTPCRTLGHCTDCSSPARMCCDYVMQGYQRIKNRTKIIIVNEALGY